MRNKNKRRTARGLGLVAAWRRRAGRAAHSQPRQKPSRAATWRRREHSGSVLDEIIERGELRVG